jgi:hypothetical protein
MKRLKDSRGNRDWPIPKKIPTALKNGVLMPEKKLNIKMKLKLKN